jgi:hypothetical protein
MNYFRLFLYLYTIGYRAYFFVLRWGQKISKTALSSAATGTIYKTAYKYSASFFANTRLIASLVAEQHMQSKHLAAMNRMKELRRKLSFCTGNRRQKENITYLWMNANLEGENITYL